MNKLQQLIQKLCPNGVEWKELGEILKIKNGRDYKQLGSGDIPVYGSGGIMSYVDSFAYDKPSVLIPRKGSINKLYYVDSPFWNVDTIFYTEINTDMTFARYVYHCLIKAHLEQYNTAGGVPSLTQKVLNSVKIPVPPLPVQREIVRILDNFTELTAELTAELQARKSQYEYYREKLLSNPIGKTNEMAIGNIYSFQYGKGNKIPTGIGKYPIYGSNGIVGSFDEYNNENAPVIGHIGAYAGIVNWASGKHFVTYNGVICKCVNKEVMPKFGYYLLLMQDYLSMANSGSQPFVSYDILNKPIVKVPSLDEQKRIVSILDKFDTLTNSITEGLPKEIELRQKQYEYYRDLLLTFPSKNNNK